MVGLLRPSWRSAALAARTFYPRIQPGRQGGTLQSGSAVDYPESKQRMANGGLQGAEGPRTAAPLGDDPAEAAWPFVAGRRVVFLLDASSSIERRILARWIETHRPEAMSPANCEVLAIPPSRRR